MAWSIKKRLARVALKSRARMLLDRRQYVGAGAAQANGGRTNAPRAAREGEDAFTRHTVGEELRNANAARGAHAHFN